MPYARRRRLKRNRQARAKELNGNRPLELIFIPPDDVPLIWPLCEVYIEEGCQFGEVPPQIIYEKVQTGEQQLWIAWSDHCEGAGVTQLINSPDMDDPKITRLVCLFVCMSCDDFERCRAELAPQWEVWAKSQGVASMRIMGRPGWERIMKDFGYVKRWVCVDKRI